MYKTSGHGRAFLAGPGVFLGGVEETCRDNMECVFDRRSGESRVHVLCRGEHCALKAENTEQEVRSNRDRSHQQVGSPGDLGSAKQWRTSGSCLPVHKRPGQSGWRNKFKSCF